MLLLLLLLTKYIKVSTKILSSKTVFDVDNKKLYLRKKQHIKMISEGSCDMF